MNKLFTKIAGVALGLTMAVGVGVTVGLTVEHNEVGPVYAAVDDEHQLDSFTGKGSGTVLNNRNTPASISISDQGYPIKALKIGWSHNKTGTARVTATVTVGGDDFGTGQLAFSASQNPLVIEGTESMTGAISITWSNSYSSTKNGGTLYINDIWLVEGEVSTKTATSLTLTAAGNKTLLDKSETVQLSSVVKDDEDNVIAGAAVTYSSSDETVATVNASGLVTASSSKYGSTVITASYAGDEEYRSCTSKLTIKVANPLVSSFVIADIASENSWENSEPYDSLGTISNVTITGSGTGNNKKYYSSDESWRFYSSGNGTITISVNGFYYLKTITFTASDYYFTEAPDENWSYSSKVFTANNRFQKSVSLGNTSSGNSKIKQIDVEVAFDWCGYFLNTFTCSGVGDGSITVDNPTNVWSDLNTKFTKSDSALKTALKVITANKDSSNLEEQAMARYDLVIRKYGTGTYADFIGRFSTGGANAAARVGDNSLGLSQVDSATLIIIAISLVGVIAVGGYFVIRRRKENN